MKNKPAISIIFGHDNECYKCEADGIENVTPTVYIDDKIENKTKGGFFCKKCFYEIIQDYLKNWGIK